MTTRELIESYEKSWSDTTIIFGVPSRHYSPVEQAGELVKRHGLNAARHIAIEKAGEFPAAWNNWKAVAEILFSASD